MFGLSLGDASLKYIILYAKSGARWDPLGMILGRCLVISGILNKVIVGVRHRSRNRKMSKRSKAYHVHDQRMMNTFTSFEVALPSLKRSLDSAAKWRPQQAPQQKGL